MSFWSDLLNKFSGSAEPGGKPVAQKPVSTPEVHPKGLTYEVVQFQMDYNGRPLCSKPFFDVKSKNDQRLTTFPEPQKPLETDRAEFLGLVADTGFHPLNKMIAFQQWGPDSKEEDGRESRPYLWFDDAAAENLCKALTGSPVRRLILIFTKLKPGALLHFAKALKNAPAKAAAVASPASGRKAGGSLLDMLGLRWAFSGDDLTDDPEVAGEIAKVAGFLGLERLSLLTSKFNGTVESALAEGLKGAPRLKTIRVFQRDDGNTWPEIKTRWSGK